MASISTRRDAIEHHKFEQLRDGEAGDLDYSGDCEAPTHMHVVGRPDAVTVGLGIEPDRSSAAWMLVRCRKCAKCLRHRAGLWIARARDETRIADRTWFGTLTIRPEDRYRISYAASVRLHAGGTFMSALTDDEKFKERVVQISDDVTKFLKRCRKNSGARLRYLLVVEAHKDGFPHFHILLHEWDGRITKAQLEKAWRLGFSHWRLVERDERTAFYVCKYLAKSAMTRVRASQRYGAECYVRAAAHLMGAVADLKAIRRRSADKEVCKESRSPNPLSIYDDFWKKGSLPQEK